MSKGRPNGRLRIGTRGSALALAQARTVADALGPGAELIAIKTTGDRGGAPGDKSRFVKEIEDALLAGEVDVAVHSAKDVPELSRRASRSPPCRPPRTRATL